jgi:bacitracin transport system permease protein
VSYTKKSYWLALLMAEIYSFAGLFMSMSNTMKTLYPITGLMGVAGYYDTSLNSQIASSLVLLLCGLFSFFLLIGHSRQKKGGKIHGK